MPQEYQLIHLTAADLKQRAMKAPAILLPLASIETLGTHGPVGLDYSVAQAVTPYIAQRTGCIAAPTIPYGDTMEFCGMEGTIHIPPDILESYCYATASSLLRTCGARAVVFLNFHGLNGAASAAVCRRLKSEELESATVDWWGAVGEHGKDLLDDQENGRGHGAEMITSVALAINEQSVHLDRASCETPLPALQAVNRWNKTPFRTFGNFPAYCKSGAWGDISGASAEKGRKLIAGGIEAISQFILEAFGA